MAAGPVTVLFTDLVSSTELLQRVGDEQAHRVLRAHQRLLRDAVAVHGGHEVKWTGDGLMTTFASSADAVRCAVAMQQTTRVRAVGERLAMRAGLHVGEALRDEGDWVGASVVVARRLCDRAAAGQILCSALVVELLGGRRAFRFGEVGALELKGVAAPVAAYEVEYERDDPAAVLRHTPFTGRATELARLERRLEEARGGHGGVVMLAGEPGIGKTRTLEEFAETARAQEALVVWGRCYEGEAARPYGPFVEALTEYVRSASPEMLRADLGASASPLGRLVPVLRERLPDLREPEGLKPDEERMRLIDAVTQCWLAVAARTPVVLVLDDLHWADAGTVALLRHVGRFAARGRLLVLGAYRDVEVGREHPLADVLGVLPRETTYEQVPLGGLEPAAVQELLESLGDHDVAADFVAAVARETSGNPFFIRALLLHLLEEGALARDGGRWVVTRPLERLGLPETVRQVIERRLGRVSEVTMRLLRVAAAFTGGIDFEVARRVAELMEAAALDALDEALGAQLLVATGGAHTYDFTHALVRHTLYEALSPARQVRLHRQLAETMEAVYGARAAEHAAEIARHYHRSAPLPGAERGVPWCLAAAKQAEQATAFALVADHLRAALDLLPPAAPERRGLSWRLGLALVWALRFDDAVAAARDAAHLIANSKSPEAAADYLVAIVEAMFAAGYWRGAWELSPHGLSYVGSRRDPTWALLMSAEVSRREAHDPENPGIMLDCPERHEVARILEDHGLLDRAVAVPAASRQDLLARIGGKATEPMMAGEYRRGLTFWNDLADALLSGGLIAQATHSYAMVVRCHVALGNLDEASATYDRAVALAERLPGPSQAALEVRAVGFDLRLARDDGWRDMLAEEPRAGRASASQRLAMVLNEPGMYSSRAGTIAAFALANARLGQVDRAMSLLAQALPAVQRAPGWAPSYPALAYNTAEVLWLLEHLEHVEVLEENLRAKVLEPDFRFPMCDARLALARLCALQGRHAEAISCFADARTVLDEQGARPLRAIVDYDEALMYARRGAPGDAERALPLVNVALEQFRALGMPGWIRRAEALLKSCAAGGARAEGHSQ